MNPVRLSVCMPTYNFGAFIGDTLASIVPQLTSEVEVVILDSGSTDNTEEAVRSFLRNGVPIRYIRQEARGGIDRDMARVIDLARGEYCWLFSSDDIMKPNAIARVLDEIQSGFDLYVCGLTLCGRDMNVIEDHRVLKAPWGTVFHLEDVADRQRYFAAAETTTAIFSFLGSIILRRRRWLEHTLDETYIGSCWAHVVRILRMIPDGLSVKYVGEPLIQKRSGNDSFMDKGIVHRYAIAIDGYHRIAGDVFGRNSFEARHIRRVIVNEFPPKIMLFAKETCISEERQGDLQELDRLARVAYHDWTPRNIMYLAVYRMLPVTVYALARGIYRRVMRRVRAAQRQTERYSKRSKTL